MSQEPASANNLRLLDDKTKAELLALSKSLRGDVQKMGETIAEEVLFKERLLAATVTKLIEAASDPEITLEEAVKVLTVASKLHGDWNAAVAPIARRLGEDIRRMRKELEVKSGPKVLAGPAGRLGDGGGRGRRRGSKGATGTAPDGSEAGGPRPVEPRPVDVPDGDGPGHESTSDLDGGRTRQEDDEQGVS